MADYPTLRQFGVTNQAKDFQVHSAAVDADYFYLGYILDQAWAASGAVLVRTDQDLGGTATAKRLYASSGWDSAIQSICVNGDYIYISAFRINSLGNYVPFVIKVNRSTLAYVTGRQLPVGVNGQGVSVFNDGTGTLCCWHNARYTATSSSYWIWRMVATGESLAGTTGYTRWLLDTARHIFAFYYDSSDGSIYVTCEGSNSGDSASVPMVVKITQGSSGSNPTLTVSNALRVFPSNCGNELLTGGCYIGLVFDGNYIWVAGWIPCEGTGGYGDIIITKILKSDMSHVDSWRIHRDYTSPFRGSFIAQNTTHLFLSSCASPHAGLGNNEHLLPSKSNVLSISKSLLATSPSTAITWNRTFDSSGGGSYHSNLSGAVLDNFIIFGASTNIHNSSGYWYAGALRVDMSTNDLSSSLYTPDGKTRFQPDTLTCSNITSSVTAQNFTPSLTRSTTGGDDALSNVSWADYTPTIDETYLFSSASLVLTLRPDSAGDTPSGYVCTSGSGTPLYAQVNDSVNTTWVGYDSSPTGNRWYRVLFGLADIPSGHNTNSRIDKIRINFRGMNERTAGTVSFRYLIKTGGSEYTGTTNTPSDSDTWHEYYEDITTNPNTGVAWTWDNINNLQVGIDMYAGISGISIGWPKCSEIWVEVFYTAWKTFNLTNTGGVSVTGTSTVNKTFTMTAAENLTASDTATGKLIISSSITETMNASSDLGSQGNLVALITEQLQHSAIPTNNINLIATVSEQTTLSDSTSRTLNIPTSAADTTNITDSTERGLNLVNSLTDSLQLVESISRTLNIPKTLSESILLTDTLSSQADLVVTISETLNGTSTLLGAVTTYRSASEALSITESTSRGLSLDQTLTDNLQLDSIISRQTIHQPSITDSLTITETLASQAIFGKSLADSLSIDSITSIGNIWNELLSETFTLSESLAVIASLVGLLQETVSISSTPTNNIIMSSTTSDSLTLSDSTTRTLTILKNTLDSLNLSDSPTRTLLAAAVIAEILSIASVASVGQPHYEELTDSFSIQDSLSLSLSRLASALDSVSFSDSTSFAVSVNLTATDSISFSETIGTVCAFLGSITEALNLSDQSIVFNPRTGHATISLTTTRFTINFTIRKHSINITNN